jgi:sugar/nucleoside kinase (ribokinase family)
MSKTTVTFGEIMLRLAPPGFERFLQSPQFVATFGGGEANVAVTLAGFGMPAAYVTVLPPANPIADAVIAQLRGFGVDTSKIVRAKGRMGVYYVEAGANQRPSKVVYDRDNAAIALAKPGDIDWHSAFAGAAWFHITHHAGAERVGSRVGARVGSYGAREGADGFLRSQLSQEPVEVWQVRGGGDARAGEVCGHRDRQ